MSDGTKIEWTDATANVINGCSLESPGCTNCYAMKQAHRFPVRQGLTVKSKGGMVWTGEVRFHEPALLKVLGWRKPRMIFWNAHGDIFHPDVPDAWIDRCFAAMALTPQHVHQVLTKRSARMREYLTALHDSERGVAIVAHMFDLQESPDLAIQWPLPNVWLGVSVEDQTRADERIPDLLATPAAVRWLSCEPLLGPVDLRCLHDGYLDALNGIENANKADPARRMANSIDWIVAGGESGPGARPMHPDWARSLRDHCAAAGVPFFFKQWGAFAPRLNSITGELREADTKMSKGIPTAWPDGSIGDGDWREKGGLGLSLDPGRKSQTGRVLDGQLHDGMPG